MLPVAGLIPRQLRPRALPFGGALVLSDSPEYVTAPGILYRDVCAGAVRVFYHHVNAGGQPLAGAVAVTNVGGGPVPVRLLARGDAAGADYMGSGAAAVTGFLAGTPAPPAALLAPGERMVISSRPLAGGEIWAALLDFFSGGPVQVETLMAPPEAVAGATAGAAALRDLPVLPPVGPQLRGTQPFCRRLIPVVYAVSAGAAGVQLANPPGGGLSPWA